MSAKNIVWNVIRQSHCVSHGFQPVQPAPVVVAGDRGEPEDR